LKLTAVGSSRSNRSRSFKGQKIGGLQGAKGARLLLRRLKAPAERFHLETIFAVRSIRSFIEECRSIHVQATRLRSARTVSCMPMALNIRNRCSVWFHDQIDFAMFSDRLGNRPPTYRKEQEAG
jgi:hypothetical protein